MVLVKLMASLHEVVQLRLGTSTSDPLARRLDLVYMLLFAAFVLHLVLYLRVLTEVLLLSKRMLNSLRLTLCYSLFWLLWFFGLAALALLLARHSASDL